VGIGYDCGYSTADQIRVDWATYIDAARIEVLVRGAGLQGQTANQFVRVHGHDVTISWQESLAQFQGHELPKWEAIVTAHLPNTDKLSGDSFGAITSLTYNRGAGGYDAPGSRFTEMRNIKAHMAAQRFDLIPAEFLSMRRLWPAGKDLWNRRTHEALLFRDGLTLASITAPVGGAPVAPSS